MPAMGQRLYPILLSIVSHFQVKLNIGTLISTWSIDILLTKSKSLESILRQIVSYYNVGI